jgi:hypothetical protein
MDIRRAPHPEDDEPSIADAEALFRDKAPPAPPPRVPHRKAAADVGDDDANEEVPGVRPLRPVLPPMEPPRVSKKPKADGFDASTPLRPTPSAKVEQVWSRGAEWGGTIAALVFTVLGVLGLLFILFSMEWFGLAFLTMMASVPLLVLVGYPFLITLERPVRITPEQAIRDFYTAASHHFPHYRRMWLLLSSEGRISGSFGSFEGFRSYWKARLNDLRAGKAGSYTPLKFQIEDFRSEKSAGLTNIQVNYIVNVFIRGQQDDGPVASLKMTMSLVKGPDRMWYLNRGTLP